MISVEGGSSQLLIMACTLLSVPGAKTEQMFNHAFDYFWKIRENTCLQFKEIQGFWRNE